MTMPTEEEAVRLRYAAGAQQREAALCCPVAYDSRYLEAIPSEVLERDYGCGDPTPYVRPGDNIAELNAMLSSAERTLDSCESTLYQP